MVRKVVIKALAVALALALGFLSSASLQTATIEEAVAWQALVGDNKQLNELSIPGTHNSASLHSLADVSGKCQSLSILDQLAIGVRFFDIRLKVNSNGELDLVHDFVDQNQAFDKVLAEMNEYIEQNPTEFLIVSIKEDADSENTNVVFSSAVKELLETASRVDFSKTLPSKVSEARGKIYIMSRFNADFGLPVYDDWKDSNSFEIGGIFVQDYYRASSISAKQAEIEKAFDKADKRVNKLVVNFTSCYIEGAFPPNGAFAPAKQINPWLIEQLDGDTSVFGVLVCDFMTSELADKIFRRNFR